MGSWPTTRLGDVCEIRVPEAEQLAGEAA